MRTDCPGCMECKAENDRLRAEIANKLAILNKEADFPWERLPALEAEVERLREESDTWGKACAEVCDERDELEAEVEKAERRGAEQMREAAANEATAWQGRPYKIAAAIRSLPLPGDKT